MTNPNDPWSRRPESGSADGPTEKVSSSSGSTGHTSEFGDAYGPTESFGPGGPHEQTTAYDYFAQQPGPDATRVMPPPDEHWGGYESGAPSGYPPTAAYGASGYQGAPTGGPAYPTGGPPYRNSPGGPVPPGGYQGYPPEQPPEGPKRKTGMWIAVGLGALVLVAVAGVLVGALLADKDSSTDASATTTRSSTQSQFPTGSSGTSAQPLPSGIPTIPGLGDIDELGATMGTIATNDGSTLTVQTLSGNEVTVRTNDQTQVISLGSTTVKDLPVGEMVMIQGDKATDGSVTAKIIISTAMPTGPR